MALSIGVSVGTKITVDNHQLEVVGMMHPNLIVVSVDKHREVVVTDEKTIEILPQVIVQTGIGATGGGNRLAFTAPRSIKIVRLTKDQVAHGVTHQ